MHTPTRVAFCCALVALPAGVFWNLAARHHTLLVLSHYFGGRTGNCTLAESFEGEALSRLQSENVAAIRAGSRVVQKDERFSLWETPAGKFWMPTASGGAAI